MPGRPATPQPSPATPLRQRLHDALATAMKARDRTAVAALRSTLAAIDNAQAIDRPATMDRNLAIEQIPAGAGATDVARRTLTESQVEQIVRAELSERRAAAHHYDQTGQPERARRLREEIRILSRHLPGGPGQEPSHDLRSLSRVPLISHPPSAAVTPDPRSGSRSHADVFLSARSLS